MLPLTRYCLIRHMIAYAATEVRPISPRLFFSAATPSRCYAIAADTFSPPPLYTLSIFHYFDDATIIFDGCFAITDATIDAMPPPLFC